MSFLYQVGTQSAVVVWGPNIFDSEHMHQNRVARKHKIVAKVMAIPSVHSTSTNSSASRVISSINSGSIPAHAHTVNIGAPAEAQQGRYICSVLSTISTL